MLGTSLRLAAIGAVMAAVATAANAQGSWTKKAPMAAALNEVALAAVGGKIHVIGGSVLGVAGPYHQEYDVAKDTWRGRTMLPRGLDHIGVAVITARSTPSAASSRRCIVRARTRPTSSIPPATPGASCR